MSYCVEENSERQRETHAESTGNLNPDVPRKPRIEIIIVGFSVFWFLIKVTIQCESEVRHQGSFLRKETLIDVNENPVFQLTLALSEHTDINNSLF